MRLVGVGLGPGDPDLVTVQAVRALQEAALVVVPAPDAALLGAVLRAHLGDDGAEQLPLDGDGDDAWVAAADLLADRLQEKEVVAVAALGDPNVRSCFSRLSDLVREQLPDVEVATVPGITAVQAAAAGSGTVLCRDGESLAWVADVAALGDALAGFDTVVTSDSDDVRRQLALHGRLHTAVFGPGATVIARRTGP